jgi:hypothetical protein
MYIAQVVSCLQSLESISNYVVCQNKIMVNSYRMFFSVISIVKQGCLWPNQSSVVPAGKLKSLC